MSANLNRRIVAELDALAAQRVLTADETRRIAARYPTEPWDVLVLVRWFTVVGALSAVAGIVLLAKEIVSVIRLGEVALAVAFAGCLVAARRMQRLEKTAAALELAAGFALQGLTFVLAIDLSTGSKNWPALVGVQCVLLGLLAYLLRNRLVLVHAAVCFFVFFGGETGYASGWGYYWLAMTYPVRFLAAGLVFLGVAWAHATRLRGPWQSFSRVYAHLGLLDVHLSLWFLAVFGYFEESVHWSGTEGQRIVFSFLWGIVSVACVSGAGMLGQRVLRAYGLTFLIVNVYTFYFQFVVARTAEAWWVHLLLAGGTLVWVGMWLERQLRSDATPALH